ncbi:MAG: N-methylhydantoinase A [Gammaproteobacteria bacterium]|jgi:N-methylhydantoinase A
MNDQVNTHSAAEMQGRVRIGVDVGGTFTDFVLVDDGVGRIVTGKRLTTPTDPSEAIVEGIEQILQDAQVDAGDVHSVVHGTTLVTNTVIERKGARVGLITTRGFRDALEMGKEIRYDLYDLFLEPPPTLVPRRCRMEVSERMAADGEELMPLDRAEVEQAARTLIDEHGVEAIAISFMHSYRNPAHEREAGEIVAALLPNIPFTLSSEVAPEIREFERTSTACANAYVQPMMQGYLSTLEQRLKDLGLNAVLFVMLSGGGVATVAQARRFPIQLIESGPAAGAMAACHYAELTGSPDLISFDMGGTTAKMCLIEGGRAQRAHEFEAGRVRRFKKGSGIPLKVSVVDMIEIGAGGGSIAAIDSMGLLKVGPRSAGSEPGPVAYQRGGTLPTVTDADLLLGCLDPQYFLGGEMSLATSTVSEAVDEHLGKPMGMTTLQAAQGVHSVVNENMAAATRRYLAEKGKDPRRYTMIAFGGAGPVHAWGLARLLKVQRLIVPFGAGVTSALGFLVAPPAVDQVRSLVMSLDAIDWDTVNARFAEMESEAVTRLTEVGAKASEISFERYADMRHVGQGFEIQVPVPLGELAQSHHETLTESFFATYQQLFERRVSEVPVEVLTWRVNAIAPAPRVRLNYEQKHDGKSDARKGTRTVQFDGVGGLETQILDRYALKTGDQFDGPAVIEERESTTVIGPGSHIKVDEWLNLVVDLSA